MASISDSRARSGVIVTHPNRDKPVVQATRATVVLLLIASVGLVLLVTAGGWSVLQGDIPILIAYMAVYLVMAFYVARWRRGLLPIASALALLLAIFAMVSASGWFERDKPGFASPALSPSLLGVITLAIIPVQLLLIAFAMRGFSQGWNVELEQAKPRSERGALPHSA